MIGLHIKQNSSACRSHCGAYRIIFLVAALFIFITSSLLFTSCTGENPDENPQAGTVADNSEEPAAQDDDELPANSGSTPLPDEFEPGPDQNSSKTECNIMEIPEDPELPRVGLYAGKGSWGENVEVIGHFLDHHGFKWSVFDENEAVKPGLEEQYDLLWFPGGFAAEYKNFISDHSIIRDFVNDGGLFIGSCAGAYYASRILRWEGADHEYPLELFKGKGVGPLSGLIGWGKTGSIELMEGHPVNHGFNPEKEMYYFDGPYFEPDEEESVTILARYQANNEPAVIAGTSGGGKYLLLGPHPEIGGYSEQSPQFSPEGEDGAQWPWLYRAILWLGQR